MNQSDSLFGGGQSPFEARKGDSARSWWGGRKRRAWPPYEAVEHRIEQDAHLRLERLERLYHKGQRFSWDGRAVLSELIAKHGKPQLPADKRQSALELLGVLLWGELAAWAISADLAERIDDVEAKLAATSQAHDEARHFYVLRDYLAALGEPLPRIGGLGRTLLVKILETDSLVHKLIGMQLLVESNALSIFKALAEAQLEPVLSELLPYYERDEARHVGLGVIYLPKLLSNLNRFERMQVTSFQLRCVALMLGAGLPMRDHFENLGIDVREMTKHTMQLQGDMMDQIRAGDATKQPVSKRGRRLGGLSNPQQGVGPAILDFVHPPGGDANAPTLHRALLQCMKTTAGWADRALA